MGYTTRHQISIASSNLTSPAWLVSQARTITVSSTTAIAGTTAAVIQASNANGLTSAIPANSWSTVTSLGAQGTYIVEPGLRWIRVLRSDSTTTVDFEAAFSF